MRDSAGSRCGGQPAGFIADPVGGDVEMLQLESPPAIDAEAFQQVPLAGDSTMGETPPPASEGAATP